MMAMFIKEKFPEGLVAASWYGLDVDPTIRGQFYTKIE